MQDLARFRSHPTRPDRYLDRLEVQCRREVAAIRARAEAEVERLHAVRGIGVVAMVDTAVVTQIELTLTGLVPTATGRLVALADITALTLAEIVADAGRRLR